MTGRQPETGRKHNRHREQRGDCQPTQHLPAHRRAAPLQRQLPVQEDGKGEVQSQARQRQPSGGQDGGRFDPAQSTATQQSQRGPPHAPRQQAHDGLGGDRGQMRPQLLLRHEGRPRQEAGQNGRQSLPEWAVPSGRLAAGKFTGVFLGPPSRPTKSGQRQAAQQQATGPQAPPRGQQPSVGQQPQPHPRQRQRFETSRRLITGGAHHPGGQSDRQAGDEACGTPQPDECRGGHLGGHAGRIPQPVDHSRQQRRENATGQQQGQTSGDTTPPSPVEPGRQRRHQPQGQTSHRREAQCQPGCHARSLADQPLQAGLRQHHSGGTTRRESPQVRTQDRCPTRGCQTQQQVSQHDIRAKLV